MTGDHTTHPRARLRKMLHIPLTVGVLTGAVSAGTGIGTAAPAPAADTVTAFSAILDTPLESGLPGWDWWSLYNNTGKAIYGTWSQQVGDRSSELVLVKDMPLADGGHESRPRVHWSPYSGVKPYWMGHICYDHKWWNLPRALRYPDSNAAFTLDVWPGGRLHATWNPSSGPFDEFLILNPHEAPC
ncbi:hypothetical protein R3Q06_34645 [Rhodococcus erythropolis]|uniref:hypothetical protein n=1 Tax=Rhodococcus erythropolis TaxID=1833 RepID=UPI0029494E27|nr:hypothetical protein [Rhodococcus erythropolis]MDV6278541.1 hypothetical protein [Rhodococcus erythropolis]